jgi:SPP1 gp7 family putative phage head morphogenesis protein
VNLEAVPPIDEAAFFAAIKKLFDNGGYTHQLVEDEAVRGLISAIRGSLSTSLSGIETKVPAEMLSKLKKDVFVFSGCKSIAELIEASSLLIGQDGKIRSWEDFKREMTTLHQRYNVTYLEAEHNFATQSAAMAARWHADTQGDPDRFLLQYRTAGDERVRESHQAMNGITLPVTDSFWDSYYPPNGWRCRCTAVQVLKSKYGPTNQETALKAGEEATTQLDKEGRNRLAMFRFNPGKQQVIFPPSHPYYKLQSSINSDKAPAGLNQRKEKDKEVQRWAKDNIPEQGLVLKLSNFKSGSAILGRSNIRNISSHFTDPEMKEMATDIITIVKKSKYYNYEPLYEANDNNEEKIERKRLRGVTGYNYYLFDWRGQQYRLNVEIIDGKEYPYMVNKMINAR